MADRHPAVEHILPFFSYDHLRPGQARVVKQAVHEFANQMLGMISDGPEATVGLRKLLEASDCFVRQAVKDDQTLWNDDQREAFTADTD